MTAEQISTMEAGLEMDFAVAEACGGIYVHRPSTDWNSAMFAAERFGLFDTERHGNTITFSDFKDGGDCWFVANYDNDEVEPTGAPTGPLAISRAILILHAGR